MFEPNPDNFTHLVNQFTSTYQVKIINQALGETPCIIDFYCDKDLATGSVLPYYYNATQQASVRSQQVQLTSLNSYLANNPKKQPISFIKIDTQGCDIRVLQSSFLSLTKHQPRLSIALIFIPFYNNQSSPDAINSWLSFISYII